MTCVNLSGHFRRRMSGVARTSVGFAAGGWLAIGSPGGWAADESIAAENSLEEVVVTAQKRQQNLQDVPLSAQVIGGQVRLDQNLNNLLDLTETTPAVHVSQAGRSDELFIRGIGSGVNQSFDQSVGTFIDDVYHGRSRTSAGVFLDLDRVEILKGPQSTYFGNNAIAGALNIVTKPPSQEFDAYARTLYGTYGQYAAEGAVGGPIADSFFVRVAALFDGTGGWVRNVFTGRDQPDQDNKAGRVTALYRPSESFDATVKLEASENNNHSGLYLQDLHCPPSSPFTTDPASFCSIALANGVPTGLESDRNAENGGQELHLATNDAALTMNWHRWGDTFTSVTGFYGYHYNLDLDSDGTPLTLLNAQVPERYSQISQELRVTSPADQPLEYLAGLYYQSADLHFRQDFNYTFIDPLLQGIPPLAPYLPLAQQINFSQMEHSASAFGSVSWNPTQELELTAGLRASWVRKSYDWKLFYGTATQDYGGTVALSPAVAPIADALGLGTSGAFGGSRTDHALMPAASVQWKLSPEAMTYASYTRGFKAGGFNGADNTGDQANLPFSPEYVNAYEVGAKTQWLDGRAILNLDVFRSDYNDLQVASDLANSSGTFVSVVRNAASSRSQGIELQGQLRVNRGLRVSANLTYLHAYYIRYPGVPATALQRLNGHTVQDLSDQPTQFAPRTTGSLIATYTAVLPKSLELVLEMSTFASAWYFASETGTNDALHVQPGYARLDVRLTLQTADHHWALDLIGKNLTDRTIASFVADYPTSLGSTLEEREMPRNLSVQMHYQY